MTCAGFQIELCDAGVPTPTMNSIVSALRFFFTHTVDRPDLTRKLIRVAHPRNLPVVLRRDEVARLLNATTCLKHQAALSVAYGAGQRVVGGVEVGHEDAGKTFEHCPQKCTLAIRAVQIGDILNAGEYPDVSSLTYVTLPPSRRRATTLL